MPTIHPVSFVFKVFTAIPPGGECYVYDLFQGSPTTVSGHTINSSNLIRGQLHAECNVDVWEWVKWLHEKTGRAAQKGGLLLAIGGAVQLVHSDNDIHFTNVVSGERGDLRTEEAPGAVFDYALIPPVCVTGELVSELERRERENHEQLYPSVDLIGMKRHRTKQHQAGPILEPRVKVEAVGYFKVTNIDFADFGRCVKGKGTSAVGEDGLFFVNIVDYERFMDSLAHYLIELIDVALAGVVRIGDKHVHVSWDGKSLEYLDLPSEESKAHQRLHRKMRRRKWRVQPFYKWYDLWVGAYVDTAKKDLYICVLGLGLKIRYGKPELKTPVVEVR